MTAGLVVRPAREADLAAMAALTGLAYTEVDRRTFQRDWPDPQPRTPERDAAWDAPDGPRAAHRPGGLLGGRGRRRASSGGAVSRVRELMWILASFAVAPDIQGQGIGAQLLAAALHHGRGCLRGMFAASADPAAVRRYRLAGFTLHPQMFAHRASSTATRSRSSSGCARARAGDIDLMNSVDRQTRGAAHLSDHEVLLEQFRLLVCETSAGPGLRVRRRRRLAGPGRRDHAAYGHGPGVGGLRVVVTRVDGVASPRHRRQPVGDRRRLAARLSAAPAAATSCLRGMKPPAPYVHHGSLL